MIGRGRIEGMSRVYFFFKENSRSFLPDWCPPAQAEGWHACAIKTNKRRRKLQLVVLGRERLERAAKGEKERRKSTLVMIARARIESTTRVYFFAQRYCTAMDNQR